MYFNARALFFPTLFAMSGVLAQQTAEPTSDAPDVTYPSGDAMIFCSNQDCTGTCEISQTFEKDDGEGAPNGMGFQSIYWYDPGNYAWVMYTCTEYYTCDDAVNIGPNTCYNLYDNGVPTDFYEWYYLVDSQP